MKQFYIPLCPVCQESPITEAWIINIDKPLERWEVKCLCGAWCHLVDGKLIYMALAAAPPMETGKGR